MYAEKVPLAMDLILAKLNRACIYTVPKYISYSKSQFDTKEAHHKAIGYMKMTERLEVKRVADRIINESIWSSSSDGDRGCPKHKVWEKVGHGLLDS
ncbi:uncharacterized protein LOC130779063 isoform X2 [Actinidia eriantha]|nr:uncharacterized protein LOC130779063 isoform X2 [Actinidia eriantha]XP_057493581.1 uncharacterized protein LOC130779063 isoform X2 [Actinidia eriantha]XP_057493582.1 uncharacterized protein LOC130779063 isoform X2 [Actinidia eriantha]XP_057493583.1 uncharacterized protein LOC130779063 isoform X2 [Actinidia eriantha]XP_057493585.1 uncharacterized protein LOC130779063 isoform X2 [Actinidia eriantha]XP_057493586.1 uncharacterized protein LOC130779063 isoform X2 [Actinidia eriantha]XP_05749358